MSYTERKQSLIKLSSGKVINFYYKDRFGLYMSALTRKGIWSDPEMVLKDAHWNFDADVDEYDCIHLICQDKLGNIVYFSNSNGAFETQPILNSKKPESNNKYLRCIPLKNEVCFFYVVGHNDNLLISYQVLSSKTKLSAPKVIDYAVKESLPYNIINGGDGSIYVVYQSVDNKFNQIGYKKLLLSTRQCSSFTQLTGSQADNETPSLTLDSQKNLHMCWQRQSSRQFELIYSKKPFEREKCDREITLHSSNYPFSSYSIFTADEKLVIYWIRENIIFSCLSNDRGNTLSKPERYNFAPGRQIFGIRYRTNFKGESSRGFFDELPVAISSGYKLAFLDEYLPQQVGNITSDDLRNMLIDSLKALSGSIDELTSRVSNLEKELTKSNIKVTLLESEITKLKQEIRVKQDTKEAGFKQEARQKQDTKEAGFKQDAREASFKPEHG